jgi:5'-methylthioadenosine phosphorylase
MVKIGIIGGSGLDNPNIIEDARDVLVETPYGKPTSPLKIGKIKGVEVVLIARHGREHTIPPTQVNFRANMYALKQQGCTHIIATTAVGSLREEIDRGQLVILDQFIDFTRHRPITYHDSFEPHAPIHSPMADPFSKELRNFLIDSCREIRVPFHEKGTVITIEGPRFSTKAESHMFRAWGADVINMSIAPEAILANELKIPYAAVAMSTDYDCWKDGEEAVTWESVLQIFKENVQKVTDLLITTIPRIGNPHLIRSSIRTVPHWPKQGVMFRDITTLLKDKNAFNQTMELLVQRYDKMDIDFIVGIESRGFIFGAALADRLNLGFVPIRKKGKLPADTVSQEYQLEYGTDIMEIHTDAIHQGSNVLIVDDLIATGGTALAAGNLVRKLGGEIVEFSFIVDLPDLGGKRKLEMAGYKTFVLVDFEGE